MSYIRNISCDAICSRITKHDLIVLAIRKLCCKIWIDARFACDMQLCFSAVQHIIKLQKLHGKRKKQWQAKHKCASGEQHDTYIMHNDNMWL